jgi:CubicO group peptidase (beta-lactamase class C family)
MTEINFRKVDALVEQAIENRAFPGAVLAVTHEGSIVHHRAYGRLSWDGNDPTTPQTLYDLASVTKVFTAVAVLKLIQDSSAGLDSAADEVIPELSGSPHGPLTIRQLLEHTSGQPRRFTRLIEADAAFALAAAPLLPVLPDERATRIGLLLQDLRDVELLFAPGSRVAYTSLGYFLLGVMIERLVGDRLDQHLERVLLRPLGFESLTYLPVGEVAEHAPTAPTETCPWRRILIQGQVHDEITAYIGGVSGHAGLFGTALDVASFGAAILEGRDIPVHRQLLARSTESQTRTLAGEERGWGWLVWSEGSYMGDFVSRRAFGHTGFTGTSLLIDPENDLVVSLLTNRVNGTRRNDLIAHVRPRLHNEIVLALKDRVWRRSAAAS